MHVGGSTLLVNHSLTDILLFYVRDSGRLVELLRCVLDDLISYSFFHEIDFTLSDQLHMRVSKRNDESLMVFLEESSRWSRASNWQHRALLC